MVIHCVAAERGGLIKKRKKRKFMGKADGLPTYRSSDLTGDEMAELVTFENTAKTMALGEWLLDKCTCTHVLHRPQYQ